MAIARRGSQATVAASSGTAVSASLPAGIVAGDLILVFLTNNTQATATTPTGYTAVRRFIASSTLATDIFYLRAAGGETTVASTISASSKWIAQVVVLSGVVASGSPFIAEDGIAEANATATTTHTTPSVTNTNTGAWALASFAIRGGTAATWTPPAGLTELLDSTSSSSSQIAVALDSSEAGVAASAQSYTGTSTFSGTVATMWLGFVSPAAGAAAQNLTGSAGLASSPGFGTAGTAGIPTRVATRAAVGTLVHNWVAADLDASLATGAAVTSWTSRVSGLVLAQATSAAQPSLQKNMLGGKSVVRFDGVADFLASSTAAAATSQPLTVVLVLKTTAATDQQPLQAGNTELVWNASGYRQLWTSGVNLNSLTNVPLNAFEIVQAHSHVGVDHSFYVNGTPSNSATANGTSGATFGGTTVYLGAQGGTARFFAGDVAEILVYSGEWTSQQRAQLDSLLQDDYGITTVDFITATTVSLTGSAGLASSPGFGTGATATPDPTGLTGAAGLASSPGFGTGGFFVTAPVGVYDTFSTGTAPDTAKWNVAYSNFANGGYSVTVTGGRARLTAPQSFEKSVMWSKDTWASGGMIVQDIVYAVAGERFPVAWFFGSGSPPGWNVDPPYGYSVWVKYDGGIEFRRNDNNNPTVLTTTTGTAPVAGDVIHVGMRLIATGVEVYLWKNAEAQPTTPLITSTDMAYRAGFIGVGLQSGGPTASYIIDYDNPTWTLDTVPSVNLTGSAGLASSPGFGTAAALTPDPAALAGSTGLASLPALGAGGTATPAAASLTGSVGLASSPAFGTGAALTPAAVSLVGAAGLASSSALGAGGATTPDPASLSGASGLSSSPTLGSGAALTPDPAALVGSTGLTSTSGLGTGGSTTGIAEVFLTGSAGLLSAPSFGTAAALTPDPVALAGSTGLAVTPALGSGGSLAGTAAPSLSGSVGLASSSSFGTGAALTPDPAALVGSAGLASASALGAGGFVGAIAAPSLAGSAGLASAPALGSGASLTPDPVVLTGATGLSSASALGTGAALTPAAVSLVGAAGLVSSSGFGTAGVATPGAGALAGTTGLAATPALGSGGALVPAAVDLDGSSGLVSAPGFGTTGTTASYVVGTAGLTSSPALGSGQLSSSVEASAGLVSVPGFGSGFIIPDAAELAGQTGLAVPSGFGGDGAVIPPITPQLDGVEGLLSFPAFGSGGESLNAFDIFAVVLSATGPTGTTLSVAGPLPSKHSSTGPKVGAETAGPRRTYR